MAKSRNYLPRRDAEFNLFFRNIVICVQNKAAKGKEWADFPAEAVGGLAAAFGDWEKCYEASLVPHFPSVTARKDDARRRNEKVLRAFIQQYLYWPPVGDGDRTDMGLPLRDGVRTPRIRVNEEVELDLRLSHIAVIVAHFRVKGAESRARPKGCDGAVIIWDVLPSPPVNMDSLKRHTLATRTPHILEFDWAERGKTVYVSAAWQNARGILGPWCDVVSGVIP